jgi:hypothetical protein
MADDENKPEQNNEQPPEEAPEECQPEKNPDVEDPRLYSPLIQSDNPALKERGAEENPHSGDDEKSEGTNQVPETDQEPEDK